MMRVINRMKLRDQRGFTLIELLIVIAIIAILAAIAIPQYSKYKENALIAKAQSNAKNCVNIVVAELTAEAQGGTADLTKVPSTCSPDQGPPVSCSCTETSGTLSKTCTATEGGEVTCQ